MRVLNVSLVPCKRLVCDVERYVAICTLHTFCDVWVIMDHRYKLSVLLNNKSNSMKVFQNVNSDRQNRHQSQWKGKVNVFLEQSESIKRPQAGRSSTNEPVWKLTEWKFAQSAFRTALKMKHNKIWQLHIWWSLYLDRIINRCAATIDCFTGFKCHNITPLSLQTYLHNNQYSLQYSLIRRAAVCNSSVINSSKYPSNTIWQYGEFQEIITIWS